LELFFGVQSEEVWLLLRQVALAVSGAAALWGFIFSIRDKGSKSPTSEILNDFISMRIFNLFLAGLTLASFSYLFLLPVLRALAHEGISVPATITESTNTFPLFSLLLFMLLAAAACMAILRKKNERRFSYLLTPFYAIAFVLAFLMTSFSAWRGTFDSVQIFHSIHGFHSIFTLGSVVVLDFLFLVSSRSTLLKQHVYSLFPTVSKVIWAGLSLDFLSVFLISDHFALTEKFLFTQTVIAILILNGVLLSGPIARRMVASVKEGGREVAGRSLRVGHVAGALSITSWTTITALDFFKGLTLNYEKLLVAYLSLFLLAFLGHKIFEFWESKRTPRDFNFQG
jgi:hypothetical protein